MSAGVDLSVAQRHYKGLVCAGKHQEAGALITICTGACWSPANLLEEGMITPEEAQCTLCGQIDADEGHLFLGMSQGHGGQTSSHPKIQPILCRI